MCVSLCQSLACLRDYSSPVQAGITKFGSEVQNTLVKKILIVFGWLILTFKVKFDLKVEFYLIFNVETKLFEHSPKYSCPLYVLYQIPLAQANFLLSQLKMHSHWWAGKH